VEIKYENEIFEEKSNYYNDLCCDKIRQIFSYIQPYGKIINSKLIKNILIFVPGESDIYYIINNLEFMIKTDYSFQQRNYKLFPLHSTLNQEDQDEAVNYDGLKIIIATNIAETSLTINNVSHIIDSGWVKENIYNANTKLTSLKLS
jgi:HrpA-like RNA helicase